jgi:hypothetical protein
LESAAKVDNVAKRLKTMLPDVEQKIHYDWLTVRHEKSISQLISRKIYVRQWIFGHGFCIVMFNTFWTSSPGIERTWDERQGASIKL